MQRHVDAQRTKTQRDPAMRTLFSSVLRILLRGRSITAMLHDKEYLQLNSQTREQQW